MRDQIKIEQALLGYQDGHNLVASSIELPPQVRQFLSTVTDASGPEGAEGFEVSVTGLPVPDTKYYALFCTWPAPEMPRPGCVWSHVLLIEVPDLARIQDLSIFNRLFLRPATPPGISDYERPVEISESNSHTVDTIVLDQNRAAFLLSELYGNPEKNIVILDDANGAWTPVVFAVWSQQWPRLRRSFSFSTGSLGDRRSENIGFDLQIAPLSSERLWRRDSRIAVFVYSPHITMRTDIRWLSIVLDSLRSPAPTPGSVKKFLFTYGSDIESPRYAFARLLECYMEPPLVEDDDSDFRLARIATFFPDPAEAVSLKRDQITAMANASPPNVDKSWAVTYFLLKAQDAAAFSRVSLNFDTAALLWDRKQADVLSLLGSISESDNAKSFLQALATVLAPKDVPAIWHEQSIMLSRLIAIKPHLAANPEAWPMPENGQRALWDSVLATTNDPHIWAQICGAMLRAKCAIKEDETVALAGSFVTEGLLTWLNSGDFSIPSISWRNALREPIEKALKNGQISSELLALSVWVLPPSKARALRATRADVQLFAKQIPNTVPKPLVLPMLFCLTAIGLQSGGDDSFNLLACGFFPVYEAVSRSIYPGEAWEILAPVLPELVLGLDWDRCKRLRKGLRRWLRENPSFVDRMISVAPKDYVHLVQSAR